jgi:hypothetical protein
VACPGTQVPRYLPGYPSSRFFFSFHLIITPHYISSHYISSHYISSHYISSHDISSHDISSHRITSFRLHRIESHRIASLITASLIISPLPTSSRPVASANLSQYLLASIYTVRLLQHRAIPPAHAIRSRVNVNINAKCYISMWLAL